MAAAERGDPCSTARFEHGCSVSLATWNDGTGEQSNARRVQSNAFPQLSGRRTPAMLCPNDSTRSTNSRRCAVGSTDSPRAIARCCYSQCGRNSATTRSLPCSTCRSEPCAPGSLGHARTLHPMELGIGVVAGQQRFEGFGRHLTRQTESRGLGPGPHTRKFAVGFVQVTGVVSGRCPRPDAYSVVTRITTTPTGARAPVWKGKKERSERRTRKGPLRPRREGRAGRKSSEQTKRERDEQTRGREAAPGRRARGRQRGP